MVLWNFDETISLEFLSEVPHHIFSLIVNHLHLNASSEFQVFLVLNSWLEGDLKERLKFCLPLLHCLRTDNLSADEISKMLDYVSVQQNSEASVYVNSVLQEKRHLKDLQRNIPTTIAEQNYNSSDCRNKWLSH